ncbi:MAG: hypothetical protein ACPGR8_06355 [Limisphaerales bacterium]
MRVIGVDAGYRNLAWSTLLNGRAMAWRHVDLWRGRRGRPSRDDMFRITLDWLRAHHEEFTRADAIVLERQMKVPFIIQNVVIRSHFPDKTFIVSPMTICAFYGIPKKRKAKKAATIAALQRAGFSCHVKCDHRYDAMSLALYHYCTANEVPLSSFH